MFYNYNDYRVHGEARVAAAMEQLDESMKETGFMKKKFFVKKGLTLAAVASLLTPVMGIANVGSANAAPNESGWNITWLGSSNKNDELFSQANAQLAYLDGSNYLWGPNKKYVDVNNNNKPDNGDTIEIEVKIVNTSGKNITGGSLYLTNSYGERTIEFGEVLPGETHVITIPYTYQGDTDVYSENFRAILSYKDEDGIYHRENGGVTIDNGGRGDIDNGSGFSRVGFMTPGGEFYKIEDYGDESKLNINYVLRNTSQVTSYDSPSYQANVGDYVVYETTYKNNTNQPQTLISLIDGPNKEYSEGTCSNAVVNAGDTINCYFLQPLTKEKLEQGNLSGDALTSFTVKNEDETTQVVSNSGGSIPTLSHSPSAFLVTNVSPVELLDGSTKYLITMKNRTPYTIESVNLGFGERDGVYEDLSSQFKAPLASGESFTFEASSSGVDKVHEILVYNMIGQHGYLGGIGTSYIGTSFDFPNINLQTKSVNGNSISGSWESSSDATQGWKVDVIDSNSNDVVKTQVLDGQDRNFTANGLTTNNNYVFKVTDVASTVNVAAEVALVGAAPDTNPENPPTGNTGGGTTPTPPTGGTGGGTTPTPKPEDTNGDVVEKLVLKAMATKDGILKFTWNVSKPPTKGWTLSADKPGVDGKAIKIGNLASGSHNMKMSELKPGTVYTFTLVNNDTGESAQVVVTTPAAPPAPQEPTGPQIPDEIVTGEVATNGSTDVHKNAGVATGLLSLLLAGLGLLTFKRRAE